MKQIEKNKLIIEFLGHTIKDGMIFDKSILHLEGHRLDDIELRPSWNWIMLVVEYIENLDCSEFSYQWIGMDDEIEYNFIFPIVEIERGSCMIYFDLSLDPISIIADNTGDKLQSTYLSIINFIKWYNNVKK